MITTILEQLTHNSWSDRVLHSEWSSLLKDALDNIVKLQKHEPIFNTLDIKHIKAQHKAGHLSETSYLKQLLPVAKVKAALENRENNLSSLLSAERQTNWRKHVKPNHEQELEELLFALTQGGNFHLYRTDDLFIILEVYLPYISEFIDIVKKDREKVGFIIAKHDRKKFDEWLEQLTLFLAQTEQAIAWSLLLRIEAGFYEGDADYDDVVTYSAKKLESLGLVKTIKLQYERRELNQENYAKALSFLESFGDQKITERLNRLPILINDTNNKKKHNNVLPTTKGTLPKAKAATFCFSRVVKEGHTYIVPKGMEKAIPSIRFFPSFLFKGRHTRVKVASRMTQLMAQISMPLPNIDTLNLSKQDAKDIIDFPVRKNLQQRRESLEKALKELEGIANGLGYFQSNTREFIASYKNLIGHELSECRATELALLAKTRSTVDGEQKLLPQHLNKISMAVNNVGGYLSNAINPDFLIKQKETLQDNEESLSEITEIIHESVDITQHDSKLHKNILMEQYCESEIYLHANELLDDSATLDLIGIDAVTRKVLEDLSQGKRFSPTEILPLVTHLSHRLSTMQYLKQTGKSLIIVAARELLKRVEDLTKTIAEQKELVNQLQEFLTNQYLSRFIPDEIKSSLANWQRNASRLVGTQKQTLLTLLNGILTDLKRDASEAQYIIEEEKANIEGKEWNNQNLQVAWECLRDFVIESDYSEIFHSLDKSTAQILSEKSPTQEAIGKVLDTLKKVINDKINIHNLSITKGKELEHRLMFLEAALEKSRGSYPANAKEQAAINKYCLLSKANITVHTNDISSVSSKSNEEIDKQHEKLLDSLFKKTTIEDVKAIAAWNKANQVAKESKPESMNLPKADDVNALIVLDAKKLLPSLFNDLVKLTEVTEDSKEKVSEMIRLGKIIQQHGNDEDKSVLNDQLDSLLWSYLQRWINWDRNTGDFYTQRRISYCQEEVLLALSTKARSEVLEQHFAKRKHLLGLVYFEKDWLKPCLVLSETLLKTRQEKLLIKLTAAQELCILKMKEITGVTESSEFISLIKMMQEKGIDNVNDIPDITPSLKVLLQTEHSLNQESLLQRSIRLAVNLEKHLTQVTQADIKDLAHIAVLEKEYQEVLVEAIYLSGFSLKMSEKTPDKKSSKNKLEFIEIPLEQLESSACAVS